MDVYSPELLTAQQNLLFLLKNDPGNTVFITAAKEKLLLSGVSPEQLQEMMQQQQPMLTISVYSHYSGHIHDALSINALVPAASEPVTTRDLALKEGMYIQKGQTVLTVFNPHKLWAVLNIYADDQSLVKVGNPVQVVPETAPGKAFSGKIDFIEPFLRGDNKTIIARVYFENSTMHIPVGSQVKAKIAGNKIKAYWLPEDAVIALGLDKMVFRKEGDVFKARKVTTGLVHDHKVQVIDGLGQSDAVAANAQFLMDSESFIKVNE
jgi:Cu(I)/Ag(I) efflux system membrane fusion protein